MKKHKLRLTKHTIRQLTNLSLDFAQGGVVLAKSENGTCHCASKKNHSGCPCAAELE